ncbi:MAG: PIN domain-containing protein [Pirellulales bacterium]
MILDTNAVWALLSGDKSFGNLIADSDTHQLPLPVVGEYRYGLLISRKERRLESLFRRLEADSEVLYPDRETAEIYASIRYELKKIGRPIPESDIWIAALGRQYDLEIISNDTHFDQVDGARRIGW